MARTRSKFEPGKGPQKVNLSKTELKAYSCLESQCLITTAKEAIIPLASSRGCVVGFVVARYIIVVVALATAISLLAQQISSIKFERVITSTSINQ